MKLTHRKIVKALHDGKAIRSELLNDGWVLVKDQADGDAIVVKHIKTGVTHLRPLEISVLAAEDWEVVEDEAD